MRAFILVPVLMLAVVLLGCGSSFEHMHNNRPRFGYHCSTFGNHCTMATNDQVYPTAQAKYGQMPGNLQDGFAVQEAVADHQRTMNNKLYGGYGYMAYGNYGWGGYSGLSSSYRSMVILPPAGGFYTPSPLGASSYFPSYR